MKFLKANLDISKINDDAILGCIPKDTPINFDFEVESTKDVNIAPEEIFTPPVFELSKQAHEKITALSAQGDQLVEDGEISAGIDVYQQALNLVPEEKTEFEAATWLYTAIGDAYFILNDIEQSLQAFKLAEQSCNGATNPFINLRLGQCYFELKNKSKAKDHFVRVYVIEMKKDIFKGEDAKYLEFLNKCLK